MIGVVAQRVPDGLRMGEGDFPAELDRLNWSTVMWGGWWLLMYGVWPSLLALVALVAATLAVTNFLPTLAVPGSFASLATNAVRQVAWFAIVVSAAYGANRHVWERERTRVERESDQSVPRPANLVSQYVASQRKWALIGLGFMVLAVADDLFRKHALSTPAIIVANITMVACLAALYLYDSVRRGRLART